MMEFFKFTPDLINKDGLEKMSVGRDELIQDCIEHIKNSIRKKSTSHILFLGPRGIGKSHTLLRIFYNLSSSSKFTPIRLAEEEYSVSDLDDLCRRILEELGMPCHEKNATAYCRNRLLELKNTGKPAVLFAENLQMLFEQIGPDLGKLRSVIQSDQSLCVVGSSLTYLDSISSPDEPFYRFFDVKYIRGLTADQILELIKRRLILSKKEHLVEYLEDNAGRMGGIHLLTGGNPRLVHILAEIIVHKRSLEDLERNLLLLLDQLTPFYQALMETMSGDQRKAFDIIALSDGPLSPTEIARRMNVSKPSIVVTQLRRLQKNGLVENVKFSRKRGTRYQIVERLYRIWRELRSTRGAVKVNLFVDFIKLWYSKAELLDELESNSREIDELWPHSKKGALSAAKKMCYCLNAMPDMALTRLDITVNRLIRLDQSETARQEIQKIRKLNNKEDNEILQRSGDVFIDLVELKLFTNSLERDEKRQSIMHKINTLNKPIVIPEDKNVRVKIHGIYEGITSYLISTCHYDLALTFNDIACDCVKNIQFCITVLNQRAVLKAFTRQNNESLRITNDILKHEPENPDALAGKIYNLTVLKKPDLAVKAARQLFAMDIKYFVEASKPFVDFKLEQELLTLMKQYRKLLESDRNVLRRYVAVLFHKLLHAIIDKKADERPFYVSVLSSTKDMITAEDLIYGCVSGVFTHAKGIGALKEAIPILAGIFGPDKLEGLSPFRFAIDYLVEEDPIVLEKLHPEMRQLVIQIIQKMSPETTINKEILESVSV